MKNLEFVIVGQGLAGTMLAFEMLKNGVDFKIVSTPEKSKASTVAAGMVNPLVFKRLTKSWLVDDLIPVMEHTFIELEELLGEKFYFKKDILKPLSEQEKELWHKRKGNKEFAKYIDSVQENSPVEQLSESAGFGIVKGSGYLNLAVFLELAEYYFRKKHVFVDFEYDFKNANISNAAITIGEYKTSKLVFCEGFHLHKNPYFDFVKLKPVKGEVLLIYNKTLSEQFILNKKVFVLPVGNHRFKVGSTYDWADLTENTTENGKMSILERYESLVKTNYSVENQWAGIRPTVIDRRPILGIHPLRKNISVFNGLGTKGVMLAPYFAKEMLKKLSNSTYSLLPEVDVTRFLE